MVAPWKKNKDQPRPHIIKHRHYFANKGPYSQSYGFSSSMYGCMYRCESWTIKKRLSAKEMMPSNCGAREDSWETLDSKEFKPIISKGNQPWLFIERTVAEAPILWPPDAESWLTEKDWRQKKRMTEDKMIEWHHWLMDMSLIKLWKMVKGREARHAAVNGIAKRWTQLSYWTTMWKWVQNFKNHFKGKISEI